MKKLKMKKQSNLTFKEGCEEYLNYCRARNLRDGTIKHYKESFNSIYRFIEPNTPIASLTVRTVEQFVIDVKNNLQIKDTTLFTYTRDLKTLMRYFMKQEYIPYLNIKLISVSKEPIECYTDDELKKLLKKPNMKSCTFSEYRNWVMANFLLSTGVRLNSLINIKIKNLDFDNKVVYINTTKNRKPLIIPLSIILTKILKEYLKHRQHDNRCDYLFCNVYGNQLIKTTIYHALYDYHKQRGVYKTGIHRYRHTFAKKWILKGGNVVTLQKILGHSSLEITQSYLNILISDIEKEIDKFDILKDFNIQKIQI